MQKYFEKYSERCSKYEIIYGEYEQKVCFDGTLIKPNKNKSF